MEEGVEEGRDDVITHKMDDTEEGVTSQSTFPDPPPFYKLYTPASVQKGITPPPPPPVVGNYSMFGTDFDTNDPIIRSLQSQKITQLYPDKHNRQVELKRLNHSILVCFLQLLDILISSPSSEQRLKQIENLKLLFINMHHLVNEFRPHQARETLKVILQRQTRQKEEMIATLQRAMDTAESRLRECRQIAGRLKEELKQKAQHSRITDQDTSAMDTSTSTAPPQAVPSGPTPAPGPSTPSRVSDMCDYVDALVQTLEGAPRAYYAANGQ